MKLTIFISHSAVDQKAAFAVRDWIRHTFTGGIDIFVSSDGEAIVPGDDWRVRVEEALKASQVVLVLCTNSSLSRLWVGFESGAAWAFKKRLIPLCLQGIQPQELPLPIGMFQAIDLTLESAAASLRNILVQSLANTAKLEPSLIAAAEVPLILPAIPSKKTSPQAEGAKKPEICVTMHAFGFGSPPILYGSGESQPGKHGFGLCVRAENHGTSPVFLRENVGLEKNDGTYLIVFSDFMTGEVFSSGRLEPGDAREFRIDPRMVYCRLSDLRRVMLLDQLGNQYAAPEAGLEEALEEWRELRRSQDPYLPLVHRAEQDGWRRIICDTCELRGVYHEMTGNSPEGYETKNPCPNCEGPGFLLEQRRKTVSYSEYETGHAPRFS